MSWRDELGRVAIDGRPVIAASFGGAPFFVEAHQKQGGRKVIEHEFPMRDEPFGEDMGRHKRPFSLEGYVIGPSYRAAKTALEEQLEGFSGPRILLHPYEGKRRCICTQFTVSETIAEGGMARFSMTFLETPDQRVVDVESDFVSQIAEAASAAKEASADEFTKGYDITGAPSFALESIESALATATEAVDSVMGPFVEVGSDAALFRSRVDGVVEDAASLLVSPVTMFDTMTALFETTFEPPSLPGALQDLFDRFTPPPTYQYDTETRQKERVNFIATDRMMRRGAAIAFAQHAISATYKTSDEVNEAKDAVAEKLSDEMEEAANDETYRTLANLRAKVLKGLPEIAGRALPTLQEITVGFTEPSLVLAYRLYQSTDRELEICSRNKARHPAFILGGTVLEVADV